MTLWGKFDSLLSSELGGHRCGGGMGEITGARAVVGRSPVANYLNMS